MKLIAGLYLMINLFSLNACSQNNPHYPEGNQKENKTKLHPGDACEGFIISPLIPYCKSILE